MSKKHVFDMRMPREAATMMPGQVETYFRLIYECLFRLDLALGIFYWRDSPPVRTRNVSLPKGFDSWGIRGHPVVLSTRATN